MPKVTCFVLVSFILVVGSGDTARILAVFPVPSISHQVVFRPITQELAKRGHEVTVITPDPAFPKGETPANLTEIDVHEISYNTWRKIIVKTQGQKIDSISQMKIFSNLVPIIIEQQLHETEVQKIINDKNRTFDLVMLEACAFPVLIYSHIYKNLPVIQVSSLGAFVGNYEAVGAPTHPFLYPTPLRQYINNITMWTKITELYNHYYMEHIFGDATMVERMLRRNFGADVPPVAKLIENVEMLFLNVNPVFDGIRPVPPNVVYIGGIHLKPEEKLPTDLKQFLDSSKNGVIYLSFGTNVDPAMLPAEKIQMFVRVFSQLPYKVLWKWNRDELPGRTENIKISKWLPQSDLLKHPNIKLFITQGGLQSTDEAIIAGVPMVGVPILGDQWYNVEKYVQHGIGVRLDMETLTDERLLNAIENVINDDSYRRNLIRLRTLMNDQPQSPLERAIWWTEYVLRHGGAKHLRGPAAHMTWAQYLELELVLTVAAVLLLCVILVMLSLYYLYTKLRLYSKYIVKTKQS